ncbi:MAG: GDP-mannose 4,6-dehydratase [Candidatus Neomarinimicrobiota bacterium]
MGAKSRNYILVTWGAGFIGSHLIDRLLENGKNILCLDNLNDFYNPKIKKLNQKKHFDYDAFIFVKGDIRDQETVEKLFNKYNIITVIHLAAMAGVRPSLEKPSLYTDVNINGTQVLLETMRNKEVKKFIFASSSSVYGNSKHTPFAEDAAVDWQISPYGATKKMGEILCYPYHHLYGISIVGLRFFTVYGPRQRPEMAIHKFIRKMFRGEFLPFYGDGNTARDYTYIDDIIDGILQSLIIENDYEIFNLGNSEPIKLKELVSILERSSGLKARLLKQDLPPGDVLQTFADIKRAKKRLDYEPGIHFEAGIGLFMEWFKDMYKKHKKLYA